ncbi:MAG: ribonuclease Y [Clostridia bacterium]
MRNNKFRRAFSGLLLTCKYFFRSPNESTFATASQDRLLEKEKFVEKREQALDDKISALDAQKTKLSEKESILDQKNKELDQKNLEIIEKLEQVSGYTTEQAKQEIISKITDEAKIDAAKLSKQIEDNARDEAVKKAKNIITLAIQKCAADHSSETTISVVPLPNEEMKGRLIGREGRNIRTLENVTGVDLIIDDTPEAITLSGFDPIRREVARLSIEKLMMDGRIHPGRIEEIVAKVRKEVDQTIKEAGENACFEADIYNLHPELIKILGRLKYRTSYGQNVLKHAIEVSLLAGMMAAEIGANEKIARRGGLLHDIGKAVDHEVEGTHISIGVDLATKYKENEAVIHCIAAHHNDIEPKTIEAILVQAADAISSARPGARRESLENYIKRLESLEAIANSFKGVDTTYAVQAGREIRVVVKPEEINDDQALVLAQDIAKRIENEMEYPGIIKVNVIREVRKTGTAK